METDSINGESPMMDGIEADENEADTTIHSFNLSSINNTVIEKQLETPSDSKNNSCEGSDSGVEVIESLECNTLQRATSTNSQDFETVTSAQSCDSSIISCCSNYDEAYNLLVRRNSTLLDDYKLRNVDGTSENGSESSSVASTKISKRNSTVIGKKKVVLDNKRPQTLTPGVNRSRSKPPLTPRPSTAPSRGKSTERIAPKTPRTTPKPRTKPVPDNLALNKTNTTKEAKKVLVRGTSSSRTPITTPTDDGRWPSIHSKPAPLMTRSLRGCLPFDATKPALTRISTSSSESKNTFDKYATLPRRRKERSADNISDLQTKKPKSRESSATRVNVLKRQSSRESTPAKVLSPYPKKKATSKTKIYHEMSIQTALTIDDVENALAGIKFNPVNPQDVEKESKSVQVNRSNEDIERLQSELDVMSDKYERLNDDYNKQKVQLNETEEKLKLESLEKDGIKEELQQNNERVFAMLKGNGNNSLEDAESSDSLMVLESRFQNVSQVIIKQEEEISKLNDFCRSLKRDLDKSLASKRSLMLQQQELEAESNDLQEFLTLEKSTLTDALKESEHEISKQKLLVVQKDKDLEIKQDECKHLVRISERRRQEYMGLEARFAALESKCRELLVHQGSTVSGAAVALSALVSRLDGLVEELVNSYNISEQELEDVIFHNEAYSNSSSSPDATPDKIRKCITDKAPSPKRGSSFVSAVINAIKNATAQTPFNRENSKDNVTDNSDSTELLDSETEPCLMMEHVLEDVVVPDTHSHNMISSGNGMITSVSRLTHSESLNNLSQAIINRQISENASLTESFSNNQLSSLTELCPSVSLVDQVIDVDNLVTRLLKVIRIIQLENDDYINELQDERDSFCAQTKTQKETNKIVVTQLKDWENLGAGLKTEVKELLQQLKKKNAEIEDVKNELNSQRKKVEKLNHDVCELSTALSKTELELKNKEDELADSLNNCGKSQSPDLLEQLVKAQNEATALKANLDDKIKQLHELTQEYVANKQVLTENLREAMTEAKKQYKALDNALETLHSLQGVVQKCPPLSKLQKDLEEISFESASSMPIVPPDCNANAALLKAMASMEISAPTTA